MKSIFPIILLLLLVSHLPARAETYSPTAKIGEFLRQFQTAYQKGDEEWFRTAVDKGGNDEEAKAFYLGIFGPKTGGESLSDLSVFAAPADYKISNTLLKTEIALTISVDFILTFKKSVTGLETTIMVPCGYRDGNIWLTGIKKK